MRIAIKKSLQVLTVLILALTFIGLGVWQLQRAQELKASENIVADTNVYPLAEKATPTGTIPAASVGKQVSVTGHYMATYKAPNQKDGAGKTADWEVGLLVHSDDSAILVVRGLWDERMQSAESTNPEIVMATEVTVTGSLYPKQSDDRAFAQNGELSRLDSALLVSNYRGQLYDGFIVAQREEVRAGAVERTRIEPPKLAPPVPGYYWQHISYVVVWWFMAALVLWAPFYRRKD
jgi:surfeit locus 1 family protein